MVRALSPDEECTMAATAEELTSLLAWKPSAALSSYVRVAAAPADEAMEARAGVAHGPTPYGGLEPFVFVSYKHTDAGVVMPFLSDLQRDGIRFWYDRGIPGASEWMQVLEERIEKCRMLVIFLSQAAVDSKYVRREILMADALNKPILTLTLGTPELRWGLKLLLPQYQMEDVKARGVREMVRGALGCSGTGVGTGR